MRIKNENNSGFTLLETMIYIALFSILMIGLLLSAYSLMESGERNKTSLTLTEEGMFIERKLAWALTNATEVTTPNAKTLRILRPDLTVNNPITITEDNGTLYISRGSERAKELTSKEFVVSDVQFVITPPSNGAKTSIAAHFNINERPFSYSTTLTNEL